MLIISQTLPPCVSARTHTLPHIQTHTQMVLSSYPVYMNNDLGIIKSTTGISVRCLCQNDNCEPIWRWHFINCVNSVINVRSMNVPVSEFSQKQFVMHLWSMSHFHQGGSETWEISLDMQAHHLPLPQWSCLSVDLWVARYFRRLLGHWHTL